MNITVNGETQKVTSKKMTVTKLLELQKNVEAPEMVAVQVNDKFVEVKDYDKTILKKNDTVEFLHFMGGGSPGNPMIPIATAKYDYVKDKGKKAKIEKRWSDREAKYFYRLYRLQNRGLFWFNNFIWEQSHDTWNYTKANEWAEHYGVEIEG
jgi:sulfur carrier protein